MMKLSLFNIIALLSLAQCLPHDAPADPHPQPEKRQNDNYSQLLALASQAGIAVPTDPALLLSLAPLAASLNSLLPTAPVLSALESAAPTGLLSSLVHDPTFAASWISSFEQGPSPSWFVALPTSIQSYLHTYADNGGLVGVATAAAGIASVESVFSSSVKSASSASSASQASMNSTMTSMTTNSIVAPGSSGATAQVSTTTSASGTGAGTSTTASVSSSLSSAGAARETGVLAVGAVAMAGILGLAVAL